MTDTNPPPPEDQPPVPPAAAPPAYPQQPPAAPGYPPQQPPAAPGYPPQPPAAPGYGQPPAAPGYGQPPAAPAYGQPPMPPGGYGQPPAGAYGYAPVPTDRLGRPLAEWWQRLLALIIDDIILFVPLFILFVVAVGSSRSVGGHFVVGAFILSLIWAVVELGYFGYLTGSEKGQTVGMMVLGIAVRDETSGGAIGTQRGAVRIVVLFPGIVLNWIPIIGGFLSLIAALWSLVCGLSPLWDPRRQGYHDKYAKTDVIKVK